MAKFQLTNVQGQANLGDTPQTRGYRLTFNEVAETNEMGNMIGNSSLSLTMTKDEAAKYELGQNYELELPLELAE